MKHFIPDRLRIARELSGLSLDDLSKTMHSCVTKQSLSKYELGAMKPLSKRMDYLSEALGVPKQFFTGEGLSIDIPKLRTSSQRNLTEEELLTTESIILFHAERFRTIANKLHVSVDFDCPLLGKPISSFDDILSSSEELRQAWSCGDGAIPSVLRLFERRGIWIFDNNLPDQVLGLSTWVDNKYPLIILDTRKEKTTIERLRFTAVHELGHLLFKFPEDIDEEKMCNKFASLFLFPKQTFNQELCNPRRKELYLEELIDLHMAYGVSVAAIVHEAYDLGIIDRDHYVYWFETILKNNPREEGWGVYQFPETLGKEKRMSVIIHQGNIHSSVLLQ